MTQTHQVEIRVTVSLLTTVDPDQAVSGIERTFSSPTGVHALARLLDAALTNQPGIAGRRLGRVRVEKTQGEVK